jgi:hypothetical protein
MKDKLKRYYQITLEEELLKAEKDLLKEEIETFMDTEEIDKIETDFGKFTKVCRPRYEHTDDVKLLETKLKEQKQREVAEGKAEKVDNYFLMFKKNV